MAAPIIESSSYGKEVIRLLKVRRAGDGDGLVDLEVGIRLRGDFDHVYAQGSNEGLLTTDAMRNTTYVLAKEHDLDSPEEFGIALADRLLSACERASSAVIGIGESQWRRIDTGGRPQPHAFRREPLLRTVTVTRDETAGEQGLEAGVERLDLIKSSGAAFSGFLKEELTTLPETEDRILATSLSASWRYEHEKVDWNRSWSSVLDALLLEFAEHESRSVQHTVHRMAERALRSCPELHRIRLQLPNQHHLLFDMSRFGRANRNEVFHVTTEPYGMISGTLERERPH